MLKSAYESPTFGEDSSFHVEQPVGSMSISPCGRDVVLGSKEGLHIIDLDSPYSPPRFLPHHTPWEVADVQWSPFAARDFWVVSTSNQKALVWNLAMRTWENSIEHVLHAHSRAITDINFSAHHPDMLATCAVDSFVHCWDLREPGRPAISFSDWFAGATQVKWNRQESHIIASSHDKFLRIWDYRMGAVPIKSIEAHSTKIYGIDWNRVRPGALVTCSLDRTIKFWDYTVTGGELEKLIKTPFPVWRARHTPFGKGILAMPQRGNSDLHLYSRQTQNDGDISKELPLVHTFPGHKGQVKEFLWRPRGSIVDGLDQREFQLVTWGTDRELRLHRVDNKVLNAVDYEPGKSLQPTLNVTRQGAVYKTYRDEVGDEDLGDSIYAETSISAGHPSQLPIGIGMNNISMPHSRGWMQSGGESSRVGMQGRTIVRADMNPIAWMRGVKISGWDIETLGDEITHVGEKFTKVSFESVDVRQRKATVSLHGPWGPEGASIFLQVDLKFPSEYPRAAMPIFYVQKTSSMTEELVDKITAELRTISETYLARKRGCLEGVLRYLLGECDLEESIALVFGEGVETVKSPVNGATGDESSDEDEDVGGFPGQEELGMSSELLRPVNANVNVPVAKACGAVWSRDGRLVCFFPPKKEKVSALFDSLGFKEMTRFSRSEKVFEGFGRLQTNSPGRSIATGPGTGTGVSVTDDAGSDYSDDSSTISSSSSGSSGILSGLPTRFQAPQTWQTSGSLGFHRSRSAENSQRSVAGGVGGTVRSVEPPANIVSLHDLSYLLPAKRELAEQYRIVGEGAEVCAHNETVATQSGYHHLAEVWGLLKLILQDRTDSNLLPQSDIAQSARFYGTGEDQKENVRIVGEGKKRRSLKAYQLGKVRWGQEQLGARWLVPALFDYFECIGDVQMLAMLSCVLHEKGLKNSGLVKGSSRARTVSLSKSPSRFSIDYFSPSTVDDVKGQVATPVTVLSRDSSGPAVTQSPAAQTESWYSATTTPYSTATASPNINHLSGGAIDRRLHPQPLSISTSPDHHLLARSASGLGTLASSLSRSFTFGGSLASSPPASNLKKRNSPQGSFIAPTSTGGWTPGGIFGKPASAIPEYLTTSTAFTSQTHSDSESEMPSSKQNMRVKLTFKNRDAFDNVDYTANLLGERSNKLLQSYRIAYADLLFYWKLHIQRSEVLKVGGFGHEKEKKVNQPVRQRSHVNSVSFSAPDTTTTTSTTSTKDLPIEGSLDIQRHCSQCGHPLEASIFSPIAKREVPLPGKVQVAVKASTYCPHCRAPQSSSTLLPCVICGEVVDGMITPCLNCGHVTCFQCSIEWLSQQRPSEDAEDEILQRSSRGQESQDRDNHLSLGRSSLPMCPSGCGCICAEHETAEVILPADNPRQSAETNSLEDKGHDEFHSMAHRRLSESAALAKPRMASAQKSPRLPDRHVGQNEDDLEAWRVSPFASLARGLGGGLSRGLRAKDERSKPSTPVGSQGNSRAGPPATRTAHDHV